MVQRFGFWLVTDCLSIYKCCGGGGGGVDGLSFYIPLRKFGW